MQNFLFVGVKIEIWQFLAKSQQLTWGIMKLWGGTEFCQITNQLYLCSAVYVCIALNSTFMNFGHKLNQFNVPVQFILFSTNQTAIKMVTYFLYRLNVSLLSRNILYKEDLTVIWSKDCKNTQNENGRCFLWLPWPRVHSSISLNPTYLHERF